jgi:RNA polymerase sigma factor (sigma-70 family)
MAAVPNGEFGELTMVGGKWPADAEGQRTVFEALVREHQHQIFRFCVWRLGPVYGEEVAQEVFLAAWHGLSKFKEKAKFTTWLIGIAKNKCAQALRDAKRREEIACTFSEEIAQSLHPDAHAAQAEQEKLKGQLTWLQRGLVLLKSEERILVNLRYTKGLGVDEIAELMGKSDGAVRKQLLRTLQRLRRILADVAEGH